MNGQHGLTIEFSMPVRRRGRQSTPAPTEPPDPEQGNIPRVTRLLALAHRMDQLVRQGHVRDRAELARVGGVTRARITQIMALLLLAPDIQEAILLLPKTQRGRDPVTERQVRPIARETDWDLQRQLWRQVLVKDRTAARDDAVHVTGNRTA